MSRLLPRGNAQELIISIDLHQLPLHPVILTLCNLHPEFYNVF